MYELRATEDESARHSNDETDRVQDLDYEPAAVDGPRPADPLEQEATARFRSTDWRILTQVAIPPRVGGR